jgi:hypothetical protein
MRRREKGLRVADLLLEPGVAVRLKRKLSSRFGIGASSADVSEQILKIDANAIGLNVDIAPGPVVRDGLGLLGIRMEPMGTASCQNVDLNISKAAFVRNVALPNEQRVRIRQAAVINQPHVRSIHPAIADPAVRTPACESILLPAVRSEDMNISARPGNRILISQMLKLPHVRSSIDINLLPDSEYEGFLREAEITKKLPPERCELKAVFYRIPIELISQLHFMAERNVIIYTISESRRTRTRIHDVAAVRDTGSQEIHLVPHRTRFRWASLN